MKKNPPFDFYMAMGFLLVSHFGPFSFNFSPLNGVWQIRHRTMQLKKMFMDQIGKLLALL